MLTFGDFRETTMTPSNEPEFQWLEDGICTLAKAAYLFVLTTAKILLDLLYVIVCTITSRKDRD